MTNLSDLFPAGAGKQVSFTASGNVTSSGKPVVLNSDGTVTEVSGTASNVGSPQQYSPTTVYGGGAPQSSCYDTANDRVIIAFKDANNSNALTVIAGSLSGTTFTFGTAVAVATIANGNTFDVVFDTLRNCFVVVCQENSNLRCYTGTVAAVGSVITVNYSSALVVSSAAYDHVRAVFDSTNNKTLLWGRDSSSKGQCFAISVDAAYAPSTSSAYNYSGGANVDNAYIATSAVHDPDQGRVVMVYRGPSSVGYLNLIDCSGSNPTGITPLVNSSWSSSGYGGGSITYDTANNKCVVFVYDANNSNYLSYQVVTVTSGSTVTFGTKLTQSDAKTQYPDDQNSLYDSNSEQSVVTWNSNTTANYAQGVTISGTTPVPSSSILEIVSASLIGKLPTLSLDSDTNQFIYAYYNYASTDEGYAKAFNLSSTNVTASNFLGISDAAISSAASGNITIKGGIAATGLSSLTPASDYYVQDDGTITTVSSDVKAGKALSATAINLEYTS